MFVIRACRLLAMAGCTALAMSPGAMAADPRADLDQLAYGSLPPAPQQSRGLFGTFGSPAAARPVARAVPRNEGGLLSAIGAMARANADAAGAASEANAAMPDVAAEPPPAVIRWAAPVVPAEPPPVIVAAPVLPPPPPAPVVTVPGASGGLLSALGLAPAAPPPMQAQARMQTAYAPPPVIVRDPQYRLDTGDKLRVVVYGQEGLTNTYSIDASGGITLPLIGRVAARGMSPAGLADHIAARLRRGYIREPSVAVEIESYRPFFILGEVAAPGQYPYVPNMSVEAAVAIAGGFSPRARRDVVTLTHPVEGGLYRAQVSVGTPINPGDTITVGERWF